uniref:Uncharacterized protein n=1 Tax=Rhizophora mucronata TaxID=61149 RepID=A0A2P2QHY1_RHIMU
MYNFCLIFVAFVSYGAIGPSYPLLICKKEKLQNVLWLICYGLFS